MGRTVDGGCRGAMSNQGLTELLGNRPRIVRISKARFLRKIDSDNHSRSGPDALPMTPIEDSGYECPLASSHTTFSKSA